MRERKRVFFSILPLSTLDRRRCSLDHHQKTQPRPPTHNSFRGRPRSDNDFLVDAGVGPGSKIAAAETAEWRRSRGADAALARAEEQAADTARRREDAPISTPSPETSNAAAAAGLPAAPAPPPPPSSSDPVGRQLDAMEAAIATLEGEAAAAGLFVAGPSPFPPDDAAPQTAPTTRGGGLFSRRQQQQRRQEEEAPLPSAAGSNSSDRAALFKEALRLSEFSTQQLLKLDAVELPHVEEGGDEEARGGGGEGNRGGSANGSHGSAAASSAAVALSRERVSALRLRRKALIKRAQALGDAMDRAKERLK